MMMRFPELKRIFWGTCWKSTKRASRMELVETGGAMRVLVELPVLPHQRGVSLGFGEFMTLGAEKDRGWVDFRVYTFHAVRLF